MNNAPADREAITALLSSPKDSEITRRLVSITLNWAILMMKGFSIDVKTIHRPNVQFARSLLVRARVFIGTDIDTEYFRSLRFALARYVIVGQYLLDGNLLCKCPDWNGYSPIVVGHKCIALVVVPDEPPAEVSKPEVVPPTKNRYRCSTCGEIGRNSATCSKNPDATQVGFTH